LEDNLPTIGFCAKHKGLNIHRYIKEKEEREIKVSSHPYGREKANGSRWVDG
jgi:hypothetical protein